MSNLIDADAGTERHAHARHGLRRTGTDGGFRRSNAIGEFRLVQYEDQLEKWCRQQDPLLRATAVELNKLEHRVPFLATTASITPFIGLFGTVWGIVIAFQGIASAGNTSLGVVAQPIAEALIATAAGLFAAIPAVIAYNRFGHVVEQFEGGLHRFADRLHASFSRQLEVR